MSGKPKYVVKQFKWPEREFPWKNLRAEALKKNENVGDYVLKAVLQRIKQEW